MYCFFFFFFFLLFLLLFLLVVPLLLLYGSIIIDLGWLPRGVVVGYNWYSSRSVLLLGTKTSKESASTILGFTGE